MKEYEEGRKAYYNTHKYRPYCESFNPYPLGSWRHTEWKVGYLDARHRYEQPSSEIAQKAKNMGR